MSSARSKRSSQSTAVETDGLCVNSVDDHGLKTRKVPRLSQDKKKASISTSIQGLLLEAEEVTNRSNPDAVFAEETKENKSQLDCDLLHNNEAKRKLSSYLQEDIDNLKQESEKQKVVEDAIKPAIAQEVKATITEDGMCNVTHSLTNQQWTKGTILKAENGTTNLLYWKLHSTIVEMDCYIFGAQIRGSTRYVTHQAEGEAFKFETSTVLPQDIDLDNGGEANDPRAFYWVATSDGGHLLLSSAQNLAARLDSSATPPVVVADTHGALSDQWQLTFL